MKNAIPHAPKKSRSYYERIISVLWPMLFPNFLLHATVVLEADTHADLLLKSVICHLSSVVKELKNQAPRKTVFSLMTVLTDVSIFPLIFSFPPQFYRNQCLTF